jgi:SAM-dependent methyltransferase
MNAEFNQYAATYSALLGDPIRDFFGTDPLFFHQRKLDIILRFLTEQNIASRDLSWLDVGCGQAQLLRLGAPLFGRAVGCDPSSAMIATGESIDVVHQPAPDDLPFPDRSFDLVTAACVYHHVSCEDRERLSQSISRVLRPNGIFCMVEHNPLNPITRRIVARCPVDRNAQLLDARDASAILTRSKLHVTDVRYFLYMPERLFRIAPWLERYLSAIRLGGQYAVFGRRF